jgi:hypothetical protein
MDKVRIWKSVADANQMATFPAMLALASEFMALGSALNVHFEL